MDNLSQDVELIATIDAFCAARGITKSAFGRSAVGDPCFVFDLEDGREPRRKTVAKVREYIGSHGKTESKAQTGSAA